MLILIILLTAINNWGIPVLIYRAMFGLRKKRPDGFIGCNFWGVVMDVLVAGAINVVVWTYLIGQNIILTQDIIVRSLILGVLVTVVTHVFMAATAWKEWIMPSPWHWNLGGYWHMVSETLQMAYVFLVAVTLAERPGLLSSPLTQITFVEIFSLGISFLLALSVKDKDVVIGDLVLSAEPW